MASVTFEHASVTYPGASSPAVNDLNLTIEDGEFLVLVGPSGCGKSTTLRMVAGFEELDSGRILIGNQDVTNLPPQERDIAMVFQNYALYPHMTVADNMGFALKIAGMPADQIAERVREAAKILEIAHLLDAKPKELSGGQRQRVAMGRAIVREPQVFLMDEPLSNLDAQLRAQTRAQIIQLQRRLGITTIYVTHDQTEAMTMGSRIAVLNDGVIQQVATPSDMYENPANVFVASFIGSPSMNIGTLPVRDGAVHFAGLSFPLPASVVAALGGANSVTVGVRPEAWTLKRASEGADGEAASEASTNGKANTNSEAATTSDNAEQLTFTGRIAYVESLGSHAYPYVELTHTGGVHFASGAESSLIAMRTADHDLPEPGAEVLATVRRSAVHYFHPVTGVRIPA